MKPLFVIGFRNVLLHWRHALAALLSVTASFFSINVFQGYINDLSHLYYISYRNRSMYGDMLITNVNSESTEARSTPSLYDITPEMQAGVREFADRHPDEVDVVDRFLTVQGTITNGKISTIFFGQGSDLLEGAKIRGPVWYWNALYGEPLDKHPEGGRILLGQLLGHTMDCWPEQTVRASVSTGGYKPELRKFNCENPSIQLSTMTESGQLNALDLEVAGLADAGYLDLDKKYVWLSLKDAQTLLGTDHVSLESMLLRDPAMFNAVKSQFENEVGPKFPEMRAMRWQDHPRIGDLYNHTMELLSVFRNFVVTVIISISALSVMNTMTKSLSERTREIGTLLSIGYRPKHIRIIFLSESIFLCLLGVGFGGLFSFIMAEIINHIGIFYKAGLLSEPVPFRIMLGLPIAALSAAGLVALGGLATLFACQRVLKKRIIECLHHV